MEDGRRRIVSLQEINGMEGDIITSTELFAFERRGIDAKGNVLGELKSTGIVPAFLQDVQARGIECPVDLFRDDSMPTVRR
jgi:pilus assembly protein CpaF